MIISKKYIANAMIGDYSLTNPPKRYAIYVQNNPINIGNLPDEKTLCMKEIKSNYY